MLIEPVVELIPKNTELNDDVVVLIEPVVELILWNTESNEDVVVLIEPVVELILLFTKSCEPVCKFNDAVAKFIEVVNVDNNVVCDNNEPVYAFNCPVPKACPFKRIVPVTVWVSSAVFPNIVEPLSNNIDADVSSVCNSWTVSLPPIAKSPVTEPPPTTFKVPVTVSTPVILTLPVIFWFPENVFEAVVAEYAVANLLKFSTLIWFVVPPTTTGNTEPPSTWEPDNVVIKGNSDIFLVAIYQYYFKKVGFQLI